MSHRRTVSALDKKHYYNNTRGIVGTAPRGLRAPLRRKDYVEGGNLAYLLRVAGHETLIMGSRNYIEREMQGLRPDIALVGANSQRLEIHDFTGRLLRALGNPALVIPTHAEAYGDPKPSAAGQKHVISRILTHRLVQRGASTMVAFIAKIRSTGSSAVARSGCRLASSAPTLRYSSRMSGESTRSTVPRDQAASTRPGTPPKKTPETKTLVSRTSFTAIGGPSRRPS